jgi:ketosteroid isomerase-like protein
MSELHRREVLGAGAGAALTASIGATPAAAAATDDSLRAAFAALTRALGTGDLDGFYALIDDGAYIFDEDIPFLMSKGDFKNHIDFHLTGIWESFAWVPRGPEIRAFGDTGIVAGFTVFRGKPKDSGFRQRHIAFTQGWARRGGEWKLVNWHQSPVDGHILEGSPG